MEVILIGIAVPLSMWGYGQMLVYVIPPASFLATFVITVWLGRAIASRFVLHGALIGVVGTVMYVALTRGQPEPWQYLAAHVLKVVGGAAGGLVLAQRRGTASASVG
jgi:hypothetical protein